MIGGGITYFDLITDNFEAERGNGWMISAGIGAYLPHKWYDVSYNIQILQNTFEISGRVSDDVAGNDPIEYDIFAAQVGLVFHINILSNNLTLDLGPQLQYNSDLEVSNSESENYFINGYDTLQAMDILDINNFNINGMAGLTAGFGNFKVRAQYIYGLLNSLDRLSDLQSGGNTDFKGNLSYLTLSAIIAF
ncbi:MAG: hypothetical protein HKO90_09990 [Flavobacteriaceae bacterium]|nr:hypothetical protein [Bacteroidia bacterium]NNK88601.1 hypothetical protein [Flavobacteriaceae bacterium]